ncbi:phenylalanine--tRNA ligase subunit beta [Thalassobacillus hwangdonensis]|uniref:Phenylalanine--tRNA ligase beta subunit n=1 Tax=Thalassobacillus hwangdonensis TaxID=546108 RepID=A0ABW3KZK5_9BACI
MLVSLNWLKNYVDIKGHTPQELADLITKTGIEVESVEPVAEKMNDIVVGYVTSCEQHPDADKLNVCQVDVGSETLQIVCGAPNIAEGLYVPVAKPGAVLPGNFKIKKAKLRGVESNGMICSLQELGVEEKNVPEAFEDGIYYFTEDVEAGQNAIELLNLDDIIIELGLTPNRSDCLSMMGVAYEVAAILDQPYTPAEESYSEASEAAADLVSVNVEDEELNPYYGAFIIKDVEVGPSPLWMRNRLIASGIRPINNVVDITNYVLLEYGQPLHAFDFDRFGSDQVVVRRAHDKETITTLDDQERTLSAEHLVITDGEKPVAIAGVMGGANSEVHDGTSTILLEAAYFAPAAVRTASKDHGLRSESSVRFEKGVDPNRVARAGKKACELLEKYAGGKVLNGIVEFDKLDRTPNKVEIETARINDRLGTEISDDEIANILRRLQFDYEQVEGGFTITVPTRRGDVSLFEDMLEEVARIFGYDNLPFTLPEGASQAGGLTLQQQLKRRLKAYLQGAGLNETITYSLTTEKDAYRLVSPEVKAHAASAVKLAMPMSEEHSHLRLSILPELLKSLSYNLARKQTDIGYYEAGSVFISEEESVTKQPYEQLRLSGAITGDWHVHPWQQEKKAADFFIAKGIVEGIAQQLNVTFTYKQAKLDDLHPGRTAEVYHNENVIGFVGQVHPKLQNEMDLKDTFVFDLNLEALMEAYEIEETFEVIPRYPSVSRDIALVVDEDKKAGDIASTIRRTGAPLVKEVQVFDVYQGEHMTPGKKSIAFNLLYLDPERTLKDEEVEQTHEAILEAVQKEHEAELRG